MGSPPAPAQAFSTFYLFATALAVGCATPLFLLPARELGRRFFILMSLIGLLAYALSFLAEGLALSTFHAAAAALLVAYNVTLPRQGSRVSSLLLAAAVLAGNAGLVLDALGERERAFARPEGAWLLPAASLSSSFLLGASLGAMVLGHWYLVARGLSFDLLARMVRALSWALCLRLVTALAGAVAERERYLELWHRLGPANFGLSHGLFLGARALFGLLGPAALAFLAMQCVRERSNQSATGILYVLVAFVLMGEILARYLLVQSGLLV